MKLKHNKTYKIITLVTMLTMATNMNASEEFTHQENGEKSPEIMMVLGVIAKPFIQAFAKKFNDWFAKKTSIELIDSADAPVVPLTHLTNVTKDFGVSISGVIAADKKAKPQQLLFNGKKPLWANGTQMRLLVNFSGQGLVALGAFVDGQPKPIILVDPIQVGNTMEDGKQRGLAFLPTLEEDVLEFKADAINETLVVYFYPCAITDTEDMKLPTVVKASDNIKNYQDIVPPIEAKLQPSNLGGCPNKLKLQSKTAQQAAEPNLIEYKDGFLMAKVDDPLGKWYAIKIAYTTNYTGK